MKSHGINTLFIQKDEKQFFNPGQKSARWKISAGVRFNKQKVPDHAQTHLAELAGVLSGEEFRNLTMNQEIPRIINFSGGRSSGMMLHLLLQERPASDYTIVFCNTSKETPETYKFLSQCQEHFKINLVVLEWQPVGVRVTTIEECHKNGEVFRAAIKHRKMLPNIATRWCTDHLKIRALRRYCKLMGIKTFINYIGIRYDEPQRYSKGVASSTRSVYNDYPLYYNQITKPRVDAFWSTEMPFDLGHNSLFGNCDLCFLKGLKRKLQILRERPEAGKWWDEIEQETGRHFSKRHSVRELMQLAAQPQLDFGPDEPEIICNCLND